MQEKVYVSLDAIKSLDIECKECNATVHYPLNLTKADPVPYACPNCHKSWMKPNGDADNFIRNLAKWRLVTEREGSDLGVKFKVEVAMGK